MGRRRKKTVPFVNCYVSQPFKALTVWWGQKGRVEARKELLFFITPNLPLFRIFQCREEGCLCSGDNEVRGTRCNQTVGRSPSPLQHPSVCFVPLPLWFAPRPQPFSQHRDSSTSRHRLSFICALSQRLSFVKGGACCQVASLYSSVQAHRGPEALKRTWLLFSPLLWRRSFILLHVSVGLEYRGI